MKKSREDYFVTFYHCKSISFNDWPNVRLKSSFSGFAHLLLTIIDFNSRSYEKNEKEFDSNNNSYWTT